MVTTPPPWATLLIFEPSLPMYTIHLTSASISIGRDPKCDLVIDMAGISKKHVVITLVDETYPFICDSSTNGTVVNGRLVNGKTVPLAHRAEFHIKWDFYVVFMREGTRETQIQDDIYYVFETMDLGEGAHAKVKLAVNMITGERLACKLLERKAASEKTLEREVKILKGLKHPNIVSIRHVVYKKDFVCIFLDRLQGGELFDFIVSNPLNESEHAAKFIFYQILLGVKYLHDSDIAHRDLKPENLLLETPLYFSRVILTDFGLAKSTGGLNRLVTKCGTLNYLAPEIIKMEASHSSSQTVGYCKKVDLWSLGIILYVLICQEFPFGSDDEAGFIQRLLEGKLTFGRKWDKLIDGNCMDLVKKLINVDPDVRLTVDEALEHPWISKQRGLLDKIYGKMLEKSNWSERD